MLVRPRFVPPCALVLALAWSVPAEADAPVGGDWSGLETTVLALFVAANAVPDYSLVSHDGSRSSGMQWDVPVEFRAGWTHTIAPSFSWYPGAEDVALRGTYRVQLALADAAEGSLGLSPGIGVFTTRHQGRGHRFELRGWGCVGDTDGFNVRRFPGVYVGGALEVDDMHNRRSWEFVAGFEFPIPLDWVLFGES
jgi:hypothetical protein